MDSCQRISRCCLDAIAGNARAEAESRSLVALRRLRALRERGLAEERADTLLAVTAARAIALPGSLHRVLLRPRVMEFGLGFRPSRISEIMNAKLKVLAPVHLSWQAVPALRERIDIKLFRVLSRKYISLA